MQIPELDDIYRPKKRKFRKEWFVVEGIECKGGGEQEDILVTLDDGNEGTHSVEITLDKLNQYYMKVEG